MEHGKCDANHAPCPMPHAPHTTQKHNTMKTQKLIILTTILTILSCLSPNSIAQTIYVDASNNTGIEDGSEEHPFNTIKEGIDSASEQDTVFVVHGTYEESYIPIEKPICLKGEDAETTIINGTITRIDTVENNFPCSLLKLSFNRFVRSPYSVGYSPLQVTSCHFNAFIDTLVIAKAAATLSLTDNTITDSVYIFDTLSKNDFEIKDCYVGGNINISGLSIKGSIKLNSNEVGGKLVSYSSSFADSLFIINNTISDSLRITSRSGPMMMTVTGNTLGISNAFQMTINRGLIFESNTIINGNLVCTSTALHNSFITANNFQNGNIQCTALTGDVAIINNIIRPPVGETGIDIRSYSFGSISENEILLDYTAPSGLPETDDTTASCGIRVLSVGVDSICNNNIEGGTYGIYAKSAVIPIGKNNIKFAHHGMYIEGVAGHIQHNKVTNCEGNGMILDLYNLEGYHYDSSYFYLYDNSFESNKNNGLVLRNYAILGDSSNMETTGGNTFKHNDGYDVFVETPSSIANILMAERNIWDYATAEEINENSIYDGTDNPAVSVIDFEPYYISGTEEEVASPLFEIYPDPANGEFKIFCQKFNIAGAAMELYNLNGKKMLEKQIFKGAEEVKVDVSGLPGGLYFCRLTVNNKTVTKKLIIK